MRVDDNSLTSFLSSAVVSCCLDQVAFFCIGFLIGVDFLISATFTIDILVAGFDGVFFFVTGAAAFFATGVFTGATFFFVTVFAVAFTGAAFLTAFFGELTSDTGFFGEAFFAVEEDFFWEDDAIEK